VKRTIHEATRMVAVAATLAAGIGQAATAKALASPRPVNMVEIAHQIEAQPTKPGKTDNGAYFNRNLPHHEHATMSVASTELVNGKPNPNDPDAIEISVFPASSSNSSYITPLVDITFLRARVGNSWSSDESMYAPTMPDDESYHVDETGQTQINTYFTNVVDGRIVTTEEGITNSPQTATADLRDTQREAEGMLLNIVHGHDIEY
jgi:hypothetical protein